MPKHLKQLILLVAAVIITTSGIQIARASITQGAIEDANKYAWSERTGWINFGVPSGNVIVTDAGITGYAWSENFGWINLAPATSGVRNDGQGNLSGYAWGENLGWINFTGVVINYAGWFTGNASGEQTGKIRFYNSNFKVRSEWRPRRARPMCNNALDDDGDAKIDYPADSDCSSLDDTTEYDDTNEPVIHTQDDLIENSAPAAGTLAPIISGGVGIKNPANPAGGQESDDPETIVEVKPELEVRSPKSEVRSRESGVGRVLAAPIKKISAVINVLLPDSIKPDVPSAEIAKEVKEGVAELALNEQIKVKQVKKEIPAETSFVQTAASDDGQKQFFWGAAAILLALAVGAATLVKSRLFLNTK